MDERFFDELKRYVEFTEDDALALRELRPLFSECAHRTVDVFYDRILEHPRARAAITGGTAQVDRIKATLRRWLVELGDGAYDQTYFERRAAIGRRHVLIELPQVFMVGAMNVVRREVTAYVRARSGYPADKLDRALSAVHKILDIDLAIMLETYHEDSLAKVVRSERRAMIGELGARVNHELRHRLGIIKSSAFLLERQLESGKESIPATVVAKHVGKIQHGAERAGSIVAALLDLARELKPSLVLTDVNALVRDAIASVQARPGGAVECELAHNLPRAKVDPELMTSVIANLVENAWHAQDGAPGRVVVSTANGGSTIKIDVADEGRGISPDALPHLFEPFFTTREDGTGLGLALAREIVTAHGGTIQARNRPDRTGAVFTVALPAEPREP